MKTGRKYFTTEFVLPDASGKRISPREYWLKKHLLLIVDRSLGCVRLRRFLLDINSVYADLQGLGVEVLVITRDDITTLSRIASEDGTRFPLLSDPSGDVACSVSNHHVAVLAVDKFSEIYGKWEVDDENELPAVRELLDRMRLVESECPECGAAAWSPE